VCESMMIEVPVIVAQASSQQTVAILQWLGVLVAVAVVIAVVGVLARRFLRPTEDVDGPAMSAGFTLADLREMRAQGHLTEEEFAAAKARMIAQSRASLRDESAVTEVSTGVPPSDAGKGHPENPEDSEEPDN